MNTNFKLLTTETFESVYCDFYYNANDEVLVSREQIGKALGYANPQKAIQKIHLKHRDRLESLCIRIVENCKPQNGGAGVDVETVYYTQRGIMEICRWSRQPKANDFMDWAWDIIEKNKCRQNNSFETSFVNALNSVAESVNIINNRLSELENTHQLLPSSNNGYRKPYKPWFSKMQPKYILLEEYFNITRGQLYRNILLEMENLYDLDTQQIQADYCYENNINSCYPLEPYEFVPKYRDMIENIVNSNLIKYGIASETDPIASTKHITIFDTPIADDAREVK